MHAHVFPRIASRLHVFALIFDWCNGLPVSLVISSVELVLFVWVVRNSKTKLETSSVITFSKPRSNNKNISQQKTQCTKYIKQFVSNLSFIIKHYLCVNLHIFVQYFFGRSNFGLWFLWLSLFLNQVFLK